MVHRGCTVEGQNWCSQKSESIRGGAKFLTAKRVNQWSASLVLMLGVVRLFAWRPVMIHLVDRVLHMLVELLWALIARLIGFAIAL